jgi:conjugal transfer pilus assembly protein TraB
MPVFLQALLQWTRRRPALALLLGGGVGLLAYWQLQPAPVARPKVAQAQAVPGLGAERAILEKTLLDVQKDNEQLRLTLQEQQRTLQQMQQTQATAERERQAAAQAQEQRLEDLVRRAQQTQTARPAPKPKLQPAPAPPVTRTASTPTAVVPEPPAGVVPRAAGIQILRSSTAASFAGPPPSAARADTPYLPAGAYAEGRLVTGVFATSRQGGALPVLFAVTKPFDGLFQLQGPGLRPLATALPVEGCLILGKAQADLGSQRVLVQLDTLSCVFPDGATFERPLKGYATGEDGTLGLFGQLETRDSAYLARTFLTSLLSGAAEAFALAKRTVVVTPFGGTQSTLQGGAVGETAGFSALASATAQLSQFYLQQAAQLLPVLWAPSGTRARLILQEGLPLEGLPTATTLVEGGHP